MFNENRKGIKYFIEREDTHKWYTFEWEKKPVISFGGWPVGLQPRLEEGWGNNPHKCLCFDNKEEAMEYKEAYVTMENCIVTEHEFVD